MYYFYLTIISVYLVNSGQSVQLNSHDKTYLNDSRIIEQANPVVKAIFIQKPYANQQEQDSIRWRTIDDKLNNKYDINRKSTKINIRSIEETNLKNLNQELDSSYIEAKHEELRRRTLRIRTLTSHQNDLRKQLESNETKINEQLRENDLQNLNFVNIQMLINSIQKCIRTWERIQNELQKLYRDQIFEEKKLLELYKIKRPNDRDVLKQLHQTIERWELIYNQLLNMQLNEKKRNDERQRNYEKLLIDMETAQKSLHDPHLSKSSEYHSPTMSKIIPNLPSEVIYPYSRDQFPTKPIEISSSLSSHSFYNESHLSGMKTSDYPVIHNIQSVNANDRNYPVLSQTSKIRPGLEENSLIFRRPESLSLKDVQCLDKWFDDLGREDAEWIAKTQLKNEELFRELVRLQKLQWDTLLIEHNKNKQKSIPQTFECKLENKQLCDAEEENFKRKFNEYRIDRYPSNIDQYNNQQIHNPASTS